MRGASANLALLLAGAAVLSLAAAKVPSREELDQGLSFLSVEESAYAASGSTGATGASEPEVETSDEDPELARLEAKVADALRAQRKAEAKVAPYREKASKIREKLVAKLEGVHSSLTEASAADEARQHADVLGKLSSSTDAIEAARKLKEQHKAVATEMHGLETALDARKNATSNAEAELKAYRERHLREATKRYKVANAKLHEISELLQARLALAQQASTAVQKAEENRMSSEVVMARMDASRKATAAARATQEWKDAQVKYVEKAEQAMLHERAKLYGEPEQKAESKEPPQDGSEDPLIQGLSEAAAEAEADSQAAREQLASKHGGMADAPAPAAEQKEVAREKAAEARLAAITDGSGSSFEGDAGEEAAPAAAPAAGDKEGEAEDAEATGATGVDDEASEKSALQAASEAADEAMKESGDGPAAPHLKKIAGTLERIEGKLGIIHSAVTSGSDATGAGPDATGAGEETGATGGEDETGATGGEDESSATGGEDESSEEEKKEEGEGDAEDGPGDGEGSSGGAAEEGSADGAGAGGAGGAGGKGKGGKGKKSAADGFRPATSVPVGSLGGTEEKPEVQMVPTIEHKKNIEHHDSCKETGEGCSPAPGNPEALPSELPLGDNVSTRGVSTGTLQVASGLRGAMRS